MSGVTGRSSASILPAVRRGGCLLPSPTRRVRPISPRSSNTAQSRPSSFSAAHAVSPFRNPEAQPSTPRRRASANKAPPPAWWETPKVPRKQPPRSLPHADDAQSSSSPNGEAESSTFPSAGTIEDGPAPAWWYSTKSASDADSRPDHWQPEELASEIYTLSSSLTSSDHSPETSVPDGLVDHTQPPDQDQADSNKADADPGPDYAEEHGLPTTFSPPLQQSQNSYLSAADPFSDIFSQQSTSKLPRYGEGDGEPGPILAELLQARLGASKFTELRKQTGLTHADLLRIGTLAADTRESDEAILQAASGFRLPPRVLLYRVARNMRALKGVLRAKCRLLWIALKDGEEGGVLQAAFELFRIKSYEMTLHGHPMQVNVDYAVINRILRKFVERGETKAHVALGYSAKHEGEFLSRRGRLTIARKAELANQALDNLKAAATIGWPESMEYLGKLYFEGTLVERDGRLAQLWWEEGYKRGSAESGWSLAVNMSRMAAQWGLLTWRPGQSVAYAVSDLYSTDWRAGRAAKWFHWKPGTSRKRHAWFWGTLPDADRAAAYFAWSARQGVADAKLGWAECLLLNRTDLNAGMSMIEGYWQYQLERLNAGLVDEDSEDPETVYAEAEAARRSSFEFGRPRAFPKTFDEHGKTIFEPAGRQSTRKERIEAAITLMNHPYITRRMRMQHEEQYLLAARLLREAEQGLPALPTIGDLERRLRNENPHLTRRRPPPSLPAYPPVERPNPFDWGAADTFPGETPNANRGGPSKGTEQTGTFKNTSFV